MTTDVKPATTAGPDRLVHAPAESYDQRRHGELKLHFYPFGSLEATPEWVAAFRNKT